MQAEAFDFSQVGLCFWGIDHAIGTIDPRGDAGDFGFDRFVPAVERGKRRLVGPIGYRRYRFREAPAPGSAPCPDIAVKSGRLYSGTILQQGIYFWLAIAGEAVDRYNCGKPERLGAVEVFVQVTDPAQQGIHIGFGEGFEVFAPVVFQGADGCDDHHRAGGQPCRLAFDVQELFGPQVEAKAGLCHDIVRQRQAHAGGDDGVGALGDVGEGATVQQGRGTFQGLHQVGQ